MADNEKYQQNQKESQQNVFKEEPDSKKNPTMSGLDENIAGLLSYIAIIGLILLFVEKENQFVRFHALQSIFASFTFFVISIVFSIIPFLGLVILVLFIPLFFLLLIFLMYQAYNGKKFKLPFIGDLAEKYATPQ